MCTLQTWLKFWKTNILNVLIFHIWCFNSRWSHCFHFLVTYARCNRLDYWEINRVACHWISIPIIVLLSVIIQLSNRVKGLLFFLNLICNFKETIQFHRIMMAFFNYHIWKIETIFKRVKYPFTWPKILWLTHLKFFVSSDAFFNYSHIRIKLRIKGPDILKSFFWSLPALYFLEKTQVCENDCWRSRESRCAMYINIKTKTIHHIIQVLCCNK